MRVVRCLVLSFFLLQSFVSANAETNLDLSSPTRNVVSNVTGNINLAGQLRKVSAGDAVTPAELAALNQIAQSGRQSLNISASGVATGGSLNINRTSAASGAITGLVIPRGVSAFADFSQANLHMTGDLVNFGNLYGFSTSAANVVGTINASNIANHQNALISTLLPATSLLARNAIQGFSLNLNATHDILNAGVISSAGLLNLSAGGKIVNGPMVGEAGHNALLQAAGNITMFSGTGSFLNNGVINSASGSININSNVAQHIVFDNTDGSMRAANGSLNFRDNAYKGTSNISLRGGEWLSKQLNINAGDGIFDAKNWDNITGQVNVTARCASMVSASTHALNLGTWNVTGDPVIATVAPITISGAQIGGPWIFVSGGSITALPGASIDTDGGNVLMVAGSNFVDDLTSKITITGRSGAGGDIDLSDLTSLSTNRAQGSGGGNLILAAFSDSAGSSSGGHITLPNSPLAPGGEKLCCSIAGDVLIVAEATGTNGVQSATSGPFSINAAGSDLNGTLNVTMLTATPGSNVVVDRSTATLLQGLLSGGAPQNAGISTGNLSSQGSVRMVAGTNVAGGPAISTGSIATNGGNVTIMSGVVSSGFANIAIGGTIDTTTTVPPQPSGQRTGGAVYLTSKGTISFASGADITTGSSDSISGGNVFLLCVGDITLNDVTTTAGVDGQGLIATNTVGDVQLLSLSGNITANAITTDAVFSAPIPISQGGAVTIAAGGSISIASISTQTSAGPIVGFGGDVLLSSGANDGISIGSINTLGGSTQPGQIYAIVAGGTPNLGTTISGDACPTIAVIPQAAMGSGLQQIVFVPSQSASTPGSITGLAAGSFLSIDDSSGSKQIEITANGGTTLQNHNLIIPLISSQNSLVLGNSSGSSISAALPANGSISFVSSGAMSIGTSNAVPLSSNGLFPISAIASTSPSSNFSVSNSHPSQSMNIETCITASGNVVIASTGVVGLGQLKGNSIAVTGTSISSINDLVPNLEASMISLASTTGDINATIAGSASATVLADNGSVAISHLDTTPLVIDGHGDSQTGGFEVYNSTGYLAVGVNGISGRYIQLRGAQIETVPNGGPVSGQSLVLQSNSYIGRTSPLLIDVSEVRVALAPSGAVLNQVTQRPLTLAQAFTPELVLTSEGQVILGEPMFSSILSVAQVTVTAPSILSGSVSGGTSSALHLTTASFELANGCTISPYDVSVTGLAGQSLSVNNQGTITAENDVIIGSAAGQDLVIGGGGLVKAAGSISLTALQNGADANSLHFTGSQTFGDQSFPASVNLNATGINQSLIIDAGANVVGNNAVNVNTPKIVLNGSLTGNPLNINAGLGAGTIANSSGSALDLKNLGNLQFTGASLAIISAGNIVNTGGSKTIDLSNGAGNGGNLTLIAGFNFTPTVTGTVGPNSTVYELTNAATGSINLSNVSIKTGGAGSNSRGGSVLAVATGAISLGTIDASADLATGTGGNVTILGRGITIGSVNTAALNAGSVSITSGTPQVVVGSKIAISNGVVLGGTFETTPGALSGNVMFKSINAGTANVSISTGATGVIIQTAGSSLTSGLLSIRTGLSGVNIGSGTTLNVGALQIDTAGNAIITASSALTLKLINAGGVLTVFGNNGITTSPNSIIDARAISLFGGGSGISLGNGSQLTSLSSVQLIGGSLMADESNVTAKDLLLIQATGTISLSGTTNLKSTNSLVSITSISGGATAIAIGNGGTINGTAGIVLQAAGGAGSISIGNLSGGSSLASSNGAVTVLAQKDIIVQSSEFSGKFGVSVNSLSGKITDGGNSTYSTVSGAISLTGLTGVTLGAGDTLTTNTGGIFLSSALGNVSLGEFVPPGAGPLSTYGTAGTSFIQVIARGIKISNSAITSAHGITLNAFADSVVDDSASSYTTGGSLLMLGLTGINANSTINTNFGAVLQSPAGPMQLGGSITSPGSITLIGKSISASAANLLSTGGSVFVNATGGDFSDSGNSNVQAATALTLIANGGNVDIGSGTTINSARALTILANFGAGQVGGAINVNTQLPASPASTIHANLSSTLIAQRSFSAGNASISAGTSLFLNCFNPLYGTLTATGTAFSAGTNVNMIANSMSHDSGTSINAGTGISLSAQSGSAGIGGSYQTGSGSISVFALLSINGGASTVLRTGTLSVTAPLTGVLQFSDLTSAGSISLLSIRGNIQLDSSRLTANGGDLTLRIATSDPSHNFGKIIVGDNSTIRANGGNIVLVSSAISGGAGNVFEARAIGTTVSSRGGGIDFEAGTGGSRINSIFAYPSGKVILPTTGIGTNVVINNPTPNQNASGVILGSTSPGIAGINLSQSGANTATLNVNGGGIVLNSVSNNDIIFDGGTFSVSAYRPIAYRQGTAPVSQSLDFHSSTKRGTTDQVVANVFVRGFKGKRLLMAHTSDTSAASDRTEMETSSARSDTRSAVSLIRGDMFMNPLQKMVIKSGSAEIYASKNALLTVSAFGETVRVIACSGPGDVSVKVGSQTIALSPGEELLVSSKRLIEEDTRTSDGIGRRNSKVFPAGKNLWVALSDVSIMTLLMHAPHLNSLIYPPSLLEQQISNRLLKTAAVVDQVTRARGPYQLKAAPEAVEQGNVFSPVSYTGRTDSRRN